MIRTTDKGMNIVERLRLGGPNASEIADQAADEIESLRKVREGVRVLYHAGVFKAFEGEPWLENALKD